MVANGGEVLELRLWWWLGSLLLVFNFFNVFIISPTVTRNDWMGL